jgi:uncharacterized protein YndB with AHSA1/START domain
MKKLSFSTQTHASRQTVWQTLWQDETLRQWANIIDPGTYMKGELKRGNEVEWISAENGYGVTSLVEDIKESEYVVFRHQADTKEVGTKQRDKQWTGGSEIYKLEENNGQTTLTAEFDVPEELEEYFNTAYPKALACIKTLAES